MVSCTWFSGGMPKNTSALKTSKQFQQALSNSKEKLSNEVNIASVMFSDW